MFKFITFDCYDTLVAYSAGKAEAMRALVTDKGGNESTGDSLVSRFTEREYAMHRAPDFKPLSSVLRSCLEHAMHDESLSFEPADGDRIIQAVKESRPFDDVTPALTLLKQDFKLAILSNSEPDIIQHNIAALGVDFDAVVLAAEVGAYKPDHRMFHALIDRCGCEKDEIVHVAQSFYHDIIPGSAMGLRRVWINRNNHTGDPAYQPYDELPDLRKLRELLID